MREMSMGVQLVIAVVLVGVLVGVGLYVWPVKPLTEANTQAAALLKQKQDDNRRLQQFERDLPGLERQIASLNADDAAIGDEFLGPIRLGRVLRKQIE